MITIKSQFAFFDTKKVTRSVDRMRIRSLAQAGGFVRTTAKQSIRKRKKTSVPGKPPSSHSGELKQIFFGYDKRSDSTLVGPLKFKRGNAPEVLEHGGTTSIYRRNKATGKLEQTKVRIKARPYMSAAAIKAAPRFPGVFKNGLKG